MKKAMKVSKIGRGKLAKSLVFRGAREKTVGGLSKDKLTKNKDGRVVEEVILEGQEGIQGQRAREVGQGSNAGQEGTRHQGFRPHGWEDRTRPGLVRQDQGDLQGSLSLSQSCDVVVATRKSAAGGWQHVQSVSLPPPSFHVELLHFL